MDGGAARARARRAAPAAPLHHAPGRCQRPDGLHARPPRRRAPRLVAEGDRRLARQSRPRPRRPPGRRPPPRRRDGRAARAPERLPDHRDPHRRGLGGGDASARAAGCARVVAIVGGRVQARSHAEAMRAVLGDAEIRRWSRREGGTAEEIVRGADVVCTCTSAREPMLRREWLARAARERGRRQPPDRARARRRDGGGGDALRRPARVGAERGGRPAPRRLRRGTDRGRARRGADRRASRPRTTTPS